MTSDPTALFVGMFERLGADPLWASEYRDYIRQVSFAVPNELISFDQAFAAVKDLVALVGTGGHG